MTFHSNVDSGLLEYIISFLLQLSLNKFYLIKSFSFIIIIACPGCMLEFQTLNNPALPKLVNHPTSSTSRPVGVDIGIQVDGDTIDRSVKFGQEISAIVVAKGPNDEPGIGQSEFEDIREFLRNRRKAKRATKSL